MTVSASNIGLIALHTFWLMIPALVGNSAALLLGGGKPIDFGRKFVDGKRIFGDGKTWRGLIGGTATGIMTGTIQDTVATAIPNDYLIPFDSNHVMALIIILLLSAGSMLGDTFGSFIKRRLDIKRGEKTPLLDQLPFLFVAWLFILIAVPNWFLSHFWYEWHWIGIITLVIITLILHRVANIIGFKLGKKNVPW